MVSGFWGFGVLGYKQHQQVASTSSINKYKHQQVASTSISK
jgi:hypothetical protein